MERLMTVLIVEDQDINREILGEILKGKCNVLQAANGAEGLEILKKREDVAAIILDLIMPVMDGFQFMEEVSKIPEFMNIPIIVATEYGAVENESRALELGAYDFVSKPYNPTVVALRVGNAIEHSRLATLEKLKYLESFDQLTGIHNKRSFLQDTRHLLNETDTETKVAIARFDVTRFSILNAYYGLEEGDRVIKHMANCVAEEAKRHEWMPYCRLGSDDFAVCVRYKEDSELDEVIERIRDNVCSYKISFNLVLIFGVYVITNREQDIESMLDNANAAAKGIKGNYINTVAFYDDKISERRLQEQSIVDEMKQALDEEQFVVFLQPKYDSESGLPCGAEALIRWKHPEKGMISPGLFIPVFEANGFVEPVDHYMWEHVCILLRKWIEEGKTPTPVSVNVSRVNLYNPHIVEEIVALTEKYQIPRNLLQLEITESAYTDNADMILSVINKFHAAGFTILMDDFGSGYSSLNVLKDMEVDVLKIDMKFFGKTENETRAETIVSSVVRMAKWLNIATVAEGVETREQVDFLKSIGCTTIQGYYYARPMPVDEYEALVSSGVKFIGKEDIGGSEIFIWANSQEVNDIFKNILEPISLSEIDGDSVEVLRVNQAYYEMFGYEDKIMFEKHPEDRVNTEEEKQILFDAYMHVAATGENETVSYNRILSNGEVIPVDVVLKRIKEINGRALVLCTYSRCPEADVHSDETENQIKNIIEMCESKSDSVGNVYNSLIPSYSHLPEMVSSVLRTKYTDKHALILVSVDNVEDVENGVDVCRRSVVWHSMEVILNQYFRNNDMIASVNEHEYCVFLTSVPSAEMVSHKCNDLSRRLKIFGRISRTDLKVSLGVALSSKKDTDYKHLYEMAQTALTRCREQGGNKVYMMTSN